MDVEDPVRTRHDLDRGEVLLVLLEQSRHQTGGVSPRPSGDAVLDADRVRVGHAAILPAGACVTRRLIASSTPTASSGTDVVVLL